MTNSSITIEYFLWSIIKKILMSLFKGLINRCDRIEMTIKSMIKIIRSKQKTSIGLNLKNWIIKQKIEWQWSFKNISEQNDKSEKYEVLLIEKTRCIRQHVKLSEDFYFECYLIAKHFINRIFTKTLNWDSFLIRM